MRKKWKDIYTLLLFVLLGFLTQLNCSYGQTNKSDLRLKVESIIKNEINYQIDSTTNKIPEVKRERKKFKGIYPSFSSLPPKPMTLIILDEEIIEIEELDKYKLQQTEKLHQYPKNDTIAMALYGNSAKNGLIVIKLKNK